MERKEEEHYDDQDDGRDNEFNFGTIDKGGHEFDERENAQIMHTNFGNISRYH